MKQIIDYLQQNYVWILPILYEVVVRLIPTDSKYYSLISIVDRLWPNLKKGGGLHILIFCLVSFAATAQKNTYTNTVYFYNSTDTTEQQHIRNMLQDAYGNTGGLYYDKGRNKFRVWSGVCPDTSQHAGCWVDLISNGGSGGLVNFANNGIGLSGDTVQLGFPLTKNTTIDLNSKNLHLGNSNLLIDSIGNQIITIPANASYNLYAPTSAKNAVYVDSSLIQLNGYSLNNSKNSFLNLIGNDGIYLGSNNNTASSNASSAIVIGKPTSNLTQTVGDNSNSNGVYLFAGVSAGSSLVLREHIDSIGSFYFPLTNKIDVLNTSSNRLLFLDNTHFSSGAGSNASGSNSLSIGTGSLSSGVNDISIGINSGSNSGSSFDNVISIGNDANGGDTSTKGGQSIAIGTSSKASTIGDISIGSLAGGNSTHNGFGIAIGYQANAGVTVGQSSIALGQGTISGSTYTQSFGAYTKSSVVGAIAMGYGMGGGSEMLNGTNDSFALGWNSTTPDILLTKNTGWKVGGHFGTVGKVLVSDSTFGAPTWQTFAGGAAGSTTQVQFNTANALDAVSTFTWDKTNRELINNNGVSEKIVISTRNNDPFITLDDATASQQLLLATDHTSSKSIVQGSGGGLNVLGTPLTLTGTSGIITLVTTGSNNDITLTPTGGINLTPASGKYIILTNLPNTCSGAPTGALANVGGVLTICP
jgi:hypothetical protein